MNDTVITAPPPAPLAVTLTMNAEAQALITQGAGYLVIAQHYEIDSADMAQLAADELTVCNKNVDKLKALKTGFVQPAKQIIANAEALFDPGIEGFESAGKLLRSRLLEWNQKETARIAAENAAREAEARRIRQEAEQKAAAERARAEELARQKRLEAEAAEQRRKEAEAAGDKRAATTAAAAAAKALEQSQAALDNGAAKAQQAIVAAAATAVAASPIEATKVNGFSTQTNWIAERNPGVDEDVALALIVCAIAFPPNKTPGEPEYDVSRLVRPELIANLKLDLSALNKLAKSQKTAMRVPGFTAADRPIAKGSRK